MWRELAAFRFYMENEHVAGSTKYKDIVKKLDKAMCKFANEKHRPDYSEKYLGKLVQLHDTIYGEFSKYYLNQDDRTNFRSAYDKVFKGAFNIQNFDNYILKFPTKIFTEFIKGITYFENEHESERPIYHRSVSCGPKLQSNAQKFGVKMSRSKKAHLRRCYVERKIYDEIYTRIVHSQEVRHLKELRKIENLYQTEIPNEHLNINIEFRNSIYPVSVIISWFDNQGLQVVDKFVKSYSRVNEYSDRVLCTRQTSRALYEKVQTFRDESPWILISE